MKGYKDSTKTQYMDGGMPSAGESVKSGNRMSKATAGESRKIMGPAPKPRVAPKPTRDPRAPSAGDSVASGNRVSAQEAAEARHMGVYKKGGEVQKKALGGVMIKGAMKSPRMQQAMQQAASRAASAPAPAPRGGLLGALKSPRMQQAMQSAGMPQAMRQAAAARAPETAEYKKGGLAAMPKKGKC